MNLKKYLKYIDPYTYIDIFLLKHFGEPKKLKIKIIYWIVYLLYSFILAFIIYKLAGLILATTLPFATVVSGSMEPSFYRGDIVILSGAKNLHAQKVKINDNITYKDLAEFAEIEYIYENQTLEVKSLKINEEIYLVEDAIKNKYDVVVYKSNINGKAIIHRIILIIEANDGTFVITKGDNQETNKLIDQDCEIDINTQTIRKPCLNVYPVNIERLIGKKIGKIPYIGYLKLTLFG
ncbi:MAG: hypothetical protein PHR26_02295 [Candidatus ainarchaeum sp.]|nr:hypothetical protein [Candidatus ainarchaeum sp.]MDD3976349.1 hypothetical protein [Candidatus ainarchaeum sp.]